MACYVWMEKQIVLVDKKQILIIDKFKCLMLEDDKGMKRGGDFERA